MGIAIGIDLGTTNSAAAVVDPTGVPRIVRNRDGANTTPSVVLLQDYGAGDEQNSTQAVLARTSLSTLSGTWASPAGVSTRLQVPATPRRKSPQ